MNMLETWETLYEEHCSALLLYARQWGSSVSEAEDSVHDAFVKLIHKRKTPDDPVPYLFAAVRNALRDRQRCRARQQKREQASVSSPLWFENDSDRNERDEEIEVALRAISPDQREVLVMKIWGELTFESIGKVMDIPSSTAASRYRYGLSAMRERLGKKAAEELIQ